MRRRTFTKLLGATAATAALGRFGLARADEPFKAGFVYVGPVADFGWSHQHDLGRQAAVKALGDKLKTTYVESVKEGPDSERVIRELATAGNGIIFTTSFGFMNPTIKVAKQFPKVKFEHATGYKRADNVATYNIRFYEGRYVQGVIAGKMSKSGVVGYIGSVPIPEVVMGMNAFIRGMHTVNPQGKIKLVWINGWYDPGKESDAAKALIDQGADIIAQHTDSAAPLQVAEQRGVKGFGQASDMIKFAPKAQLTSSVDHWDEYYTQRIQAAMDGSWKTQDIWGGLKIGMLHMAPWTNMPDDVAQAAQAAQNGIEDGSIVIFKGPINDQSGKVKVADGAQLSDDDILGMNWLAEGIEGTLPQ
ncbi:MAG TPA: BMP family ABC transporter substrate-binding protein [Dongiaceae bacterium]|nr:BMP family ABC transporter substrate-binding protein [Dongiaceae bacterium]